jgi:sulfatase maturation enzyme AslB (radical SAM superfamily)
MNNLIDTIEVDSNNSDMHKFENPNFTVNGKVRATVSPTNLETLWINTGTLCNLSCKNCYIESTPTNDRLSFITVSEVGKLLEEISTEQLLTKEIGFTGGEPFLNEDLIPMLNLSLQKGFTVLILTNAMKTMISASRDLLNLKQQYPNHFKIRVSLDHYKETLHSKERGRRSWKPALQGLRWLSDNNFDFSIAGRTYWGETEQAMRAGYQALFKKESINLDAKKTSHLVLFPEMDDSQDVPEITSECWQILKKQPTELMCSSTRMAVKRKEDTRVSIMACTLLPYDQRFNLGKTLKESLKPVSLNHPHCSKFCMLGGGSCS